MNKKTPTINVETLEDRAPASKKLWGGLLTFGMISMPVAMFSAAREERVSFNQLHKHCHSRIKQQLFCPKCDEVVARESLQRAYEHQKDQYITIDDKELEDCEPQSAKVLELSAFVPAEQVDPLFYESSYYLTPEDGGQKPYALVLEAMRRSKLVGIVRLAKNHREHICVLRSYRAGMMLQTLYWNNEVRSIAFPALPTTSEPEVHLAEQLVQALSCDWNPGNYTDSYRQSVLRLIQSKVVGSKLPVLSQPRQKAPVTDIASALQESIRAAKTKGAA